MSFEEQKGLAAVDGVCDFPKQEEAVLKYWADTKAFETSLQQSEGKKEYTFYDGPPFATGLPHYGHILAGTIKDVVTRYAHQTGHHVERRFGWDCHGLPVEYEIDKKLGIKSSDDVKAMGIAAYNQECRSIVQRYTGEWRETVTRLGRWIDFDNDYKTMDTPFMESVWWVFGQLYEKGLVYQGFRVMPYSTVCHTPLSNFESGQNYKNVQDPTVVVHFPLVSEPETSLLAWTTTPWTLPSNLALCAHPDLEYVKVRTTEGKQYILMKARLEMLFPAPKKAKKGKEAKAAYTILEEMKGSALKGLKYVPLFEYFRAKEAAYPAMWTVLNDEYVTDSSGVGIVHQAPAFGEDDFRVCMAGNVIGKDTGVPCPVDDDGKFTDEVSDWKGLHVKEADKKIIAHLKASGRLVKQDTITHSYPHCWRSDSPLIYKAVPSWFVSVPKIKERLLANNEATRWVPDHVRVKRFHNWLVDARDWNISRNRYWGTPLPIWISDDGKEVQVISSIAQLETLAGLEAGSVTDLHKDKVDDITITSATTGQVLRRVPEVFDCWFESGSMPYGQKHYPFENKEAFENGFPADFIAEGLDQTRGWFYTLMVISTALFDKPAFQNLIVNGLVLAEDGKKMSKRLKNYPDPTEIVNKFGADALRVYLINSPVVRAEKLLFRGDGVYDVARLLLVPWFNSYRLFCEQALRHGNKTNTPFQYSSALAASSTNIMDRWILASLQSLIKFVREEMANYRLFTVIPQLLSFVDSLSKWYIRFQKDRLKGDEGDEACASSLAVFFEVLHNMNILMAPITPFLTEYMYLNLRHALPEGERMGSVHFHMMPEVDEGKQDSSVEYGIACLQQVVEMGRKAREHTVSFRTPLPSVTVCHRDAKFLEQVTLLAPIIKTSLNVREVNTSDQFNTLVTFSPWPNGAVLGKQLMRNMKSAVTQIKALSQEDLLAFEERGFLNLTCNGEEVTISAEHVDFQCEFKGDAKTFVPFTEKGCLLMLAKTPDADCVQEGLARSFISEIQTCRKEAKLSPQDRVNIYHRVVAETAPKLAACLQARTQYIVESLRLAEVVAPSEQLPEDATVHIQKDATLEGESFIIWITKA